MKNLWIVRIHLEDGDVNIGPFPSEKEAQSWADGAPDDPETVEVMVEIMAPPLKENGEPNY